MPQVVITTPTPKNNRNKLGNSKTPVKRRPWGLRRRLRQGQITRRIRPWTRSTGPRSAAGKATIAANARKTGAHSAARKALSRLLTRQSRYRHAVETAHTDGIHIPGLYAEGLDITIQLLRAVNAVNLSP